MKDRVLVAEAAAVVMSISLTVMSFNLHRDSPTDGSNLWEHRRSLCADVVTEHAPLIVCTQEGLKSQLNDLAALLPCYEQFGVSRKGPSDLSDEHCAIFYDTRRVERIDGGTFWLSESPSVPASTSWGTDIPSISTWATFQFKGLQSPGFAFQIMNTHMDHKSSHARRRGALLTWQHISSLPPSLAVIYCGGFNTLKESRAGRFLLSQSREHGLAGDMKDAWRSARRRRNGNLVQTYHGFRGRKRTTADTLKLLFRALCMCWDRQNQDLHVDWILFRGSTLTPIECDMIDYNVDNCYPSDHFPLLCKFQLPRSVRQEVDEASSI